MYLFKGMNGFSWYTKVISKDLNTNAEREAYMNFTFKKGCDPKPEDLNDKNAYEGDLYFHDKNGCIRKVFPVVDEYNGNKKIEFKLLEAIGEPKSEPKEPVQTITREQGMGGATFDGISPDDLPFY